ncbi:hypothetical protein [Flagellimonas okinawensis]|uniref:Aminotransferase class I/classII domain-containing protein n=1 Tax=Flagellimonas okinawensis TaxID=3031324 RepID=A0ABT5XR06_9FLAO|nr:hypothetical protein [[Muricauda] okinawensis]MDF0708329.1 hypothetical protein [[Muricauda] okinawensis]
MNKEIVGYGSFFHKIEETQIKESSSITFFQDHKLFYTGRHAIKFIIETINKTKDVETIWLPKYYCQHVTAWIKHNYNNVGFYDIDPFEINDIVQLDPSLFQNPNDIVLLNNFWGIFNYDLPNNPTRAIVLEDHSHGWLSNSCINSSADICITSLRKTLPVPLGAMAWIPEGSSLKINWEDTLTNISEKTTQTFIVNAWDSIDKAMELKSNCSTEENKQEYLELYSFAENYLHNQYEIIPVTIEHSEYINAYLTKDFQSYKTENLNYLHSIISTFKDLDILWQDGNTTFGLNIPFERRTDFDRLKSHLIENKIYPSELWPGNSVDTKFKYLMNIHVDFRYNKTDLDYLIETLSHFFRFKNELV